MLYFNFFIPPPQYSGNVHLLLSHVLRRWLFWTKILASSLHWKPLLFQIPSLTSCIGAFWAFSKYLYEALMHCVTVSSDYLIHLVEWETVSCIQYLHLIPSALGTGTFTVSEWDPDLIPLMFSFCISANPLLSLSSAIAQTLVPFLLQYSKTENIKYTQRKTFSLPSLLHFTFISLWRLTTTVWDGS